MGLKAGFNTGSSTGKPFDLVLILAGTNDLNYGYNKEDILERICALHDLVLHTGARTVAITMPFLRSKTGQEKVEADRRWINASLREFVARDPEQRFCVDLAFQLLQDAANAPLWDPDGIHLSPTGYRRMGSVISDALCRQDDYH